MDRHLFHFSIWRTVVQTNLWRRITGGLLVVGMLVACGCSKPDSQGGGTAVVDLDRVAVAVGWESSFKAEMTRKESELNAQIEQVKNSLESRLQGLRNDFGVNATDEQKTQLNQYTIQANTQIQNVVNAAQREIGNHRLTLVNQFREKVRPRAEKIAKDLGFGIVLTKSDAVYLVLPESDITSAVIEAMEGVTVKAEVPANEPAE